LKLHMILLPWVILATTGLASEAAILARYADLAFRPDSTTLCIITAQGDTLVFPDNRDPSYSEDFVIHSLVDRLPQQNYWVVKQVGYEWMGWFLVNGVNGVINETIAAPVPSPDGSRLLCASQDITAGFIENGIQIWKTTPGGLVLEFHDLTMDWGPENASWESDSAIVMDRLVYDWNSNRHITRPGRLELSRKGHWAPDDPMNW